MRASDAPPPRPSHVAAKNAEIDARHSPAAPHRMSRVVLIVRMPCTPAATLTDLEGSRHRAPLSHAGALAPGVFGAGRNARGRRVSVPSSQRAVPPTTESRHHL